MSVDSENIMATEPTERLELLTSTGHGLSPNYPAEASVSGLLKNLSVFSVGSVANL
jgi:hypothetical protein